MSKIVSNNSKLRTNRKRFQRRGLSLLEVILSIAILGTSMAIIGQVFFAGYRSAVKARDLSDATILCDSIMAELAAGSIDFGSTAGATIPNVPGWLSLIHI